MNLLLIGRGVIGTVYATNLLEEGDKLYVLRHGLADNLTDTHLSVQASGQPVNRVLANIIDDVSSIEPDLVLVAVRSDQLVSTFDSLNQLGYVPLLFVGNNPDGHAALPDGLRTHAWLGFPGVAGYRGDDDTVYYEHVSGQSTTLQASREPMILRAQKTLQAHGFAIKTTNHMDGWLQYHAVFIACMCQAILNHDGDAAKLGNDRAAMKLLCQAISQGFAGLRRSGVKGAPGNLRVLHARILLPIAINYWTKVMKSGQGEVYFAKHARGSVGEVQMLTAWVLQTMHKLGQKSDVLHQLFGSGE